MAKTFSLVPDSYPVARSPSSVEVASNDPLDLLPRPASTSAPPAVAPASPGAGHVACPVETRVGDDAERGNKHGSDPYPGSMEHLLPRRPRKRSRSAVDALGSSASPPQRDSQRHRPSTQHAKTSASGSRKPRRARLPLPLQSLIQVDERIYFALFDDAPLPSPSALNGRDGLRSALFPNSTPRSAGINAPPPQTLTYTQTPQTSPSNHHTHTRPAWAPHPIQSRFHWFTVTPDSKGRQQHSATSNDVSEAFSYRPFFDDWGPPNMAHVYQFCRILDELLSRSDLKEHGIVCYTSISPHSKANTAALLALRMILAENRSPAEALYPFSTLELEPFRDAGYGRADYSLSLQDLIYGTWRATQNRLFSLKTFDVAEYLYAECMENNDWNWITPNVIAFSSPVDPQFCKAVHYGLVSSTNDNDAETTLTQKQPQLSPETPEEAAELARWDDMRPRLLADFTSSNVKLVIRLNYALYDRSIFSEAGIDHLDLYFDDGTNPSDAIMRTFLDKIIPVIEEGGVVAVHCKAGLGRTGVLIGAYLNYMFGFNADEAIGFMRLMRPGCVVGPQQHFLRRKAHTITCWAERDRYQRYEAWLRKERRQLNEQVKLLSSKLARAQSQLANRVDEKTGSPRPKRLHNWHSRPILSPRDNAETLPEGEGYESGSGAGLDLSMTRTLAHSRSGTPMSSRWLGKGSSAPSSPNNRRYPHVVSSIWKDSVSTGPVISPSSKSPTPSVGQPRKSRTQNSISSPTPSTISRRTLQLVGTPDRMEESISHTMHTQCTPQARPMVHNRLMLSSRATLVSGSPRHALGAPESPSPSVGAHTHTKEPSGEDGPVECTS